MDPQHNLLNRLKHHNYSLILPAALVLSVHHLIRTRDPVEQQVVLTALGLMVLSLGLYLKNRHGFLGVLDWISTWGQLSLLTIAACLVILSPEIKPQSGLYLLPTWGIVMVWHWTVVYHARPVLSLVVSGLYFGGTVWMFWMLNQHGYGQVQALDVAIQGLMAMVICRAIHNVYGQVQEESRKRHDAERRAAVDVLTGLPNRRSFEQHMEWAVENQYSTHLVVFDIDHFKRINDRYGHDVGDLILKQIAALAQQQFRDVGQVFRWGGEEFCVVLPEATPQETSLMCEKYRHRVEQEVFIHDLRITVSVGVTRLQPWDNPESAFRRADGALYNVKGAGRNQVLMV